MADQPTPNKKYIAVQRIHRMSDDRYFEPGQVVGLDHLSEAKIKILLDMDAVRVTTADVHVSELETIKGIKQETAKQLAGANIFSLSDLVAASPSDLETRIGVGTVAQVRAWQESARKALDESSVKAG